MNFEAYHRCKYYKIFTNLSIANSHHVIKCINNTRGAPLPSFLHQSSRDMGSLVWPGFARKLSCDGYDCRL